MTDQPRFDSYTGLELRRAPWMHNPPGSRMPYRSGRHCDTPECGKELSRYDPGPRCFACELRHQQAERAAALAAAAEEADGEVAA